MRVDVEKKNPALESLFTDPEQTIFLDANFFIPPDRSRMGTKPIPFLKFCEIWLDPIFDAFPNLAIHESVYHELVADAVKKYADERQSESPSHLRVYKDAELNEAEQALMQAYVSKLAEYSQYIPERDNAKDRGEVRSLSFMAVKRFLYFAANDTLPMNLIRKADELHTGLDDMELLEMYDVIYYLYCTGKYPPDGLRLLYKYEYYLTKQEKKMNLAWGEFIEKMNALYLLMYRLVTSGMGKAISDGRLTQKQRPASERCLIWHYLGAIQRRSPMR